MPHKDNVFNYTKIKEGKETSDNEFDIEIETQPSNQINDNDGLHALAGHTPNVLKAQIEDRAQAKIKYDQVEETEQKDTSKND